MRLLLHSILGLSFLLVATDVSAHDTSDESTNSKTYSVLERKDSSRPRLNEVQGEQVAKVAPEKSKALSSVLENRVSVADVSSEFVSTKLNGGTNCGCTLRAAIAFANDQNSMPFTGIPNKVRYIMFQGHQKTPVDAQTGDRVVIVNEESDCWVPGTNNPCANQVYTPGNLPSGNATGIFRANVTQGPLPPIQHTLEINGVILSKLLASGENVKNKPGVHVLGYGLQRINPLVKESGLVFSGLQNLNDVGSQDDRGSVVTGLIITSFPDHGLEMAHDDSEINSNYIGVYQEYEDANLARRFPGAIDDWWLDANGSDGVYLDASDCRLGGRFVGAGDGNESAANVVSGNKGNGILIANGSNNVIYTNYIGVGHPIELPNQDPLTPFRANYFDGTEIKKGYMRNFQNGVFIGSGAGPQTIGFVPTTGGTCGEGTGGNGPGGNGPGGNGYTGFSYSLCGRNVISNNTEHGLRIANPTTAPLRKAGTLITGNHIGTGLSGKPEDPADYDGAVFRGNYKNGIATTGSHQIQIDNNLISLNFFSGIVLMVQSNDNWVFANKIGTSIDAKDTNSVITSGEAMPNRLDGIVIWNESVGNSIGYHPDRNLAEQQNSSLTNLIEFNLRHGITVHGTPAGLDDDVNWIFGNWIHDNHADGIHITGSRQKVHVGFSDEYDDSGLANSVVRLKNTITFNGGNGIVVGELSSNNRIAGNSILENGLDGMLIRGDMNLIGSDMDGEEDINEANVIDSNERTGIALRETVDANHSPSQNSIFGNAISLSATQSTYPFKDPLLEFREPSFRGAGILVDGATNNYVFANAIFGNNGAGIFVNKSDDNKFFNNFIGADTNGAIQSNLGDGIWIESGIGNIVGQPNNFSGLNNVHFPFSSSMTLGNTITNNVGHGVTLSNSFASIIAGNQIGGSNGNGVFIIDGSSHNQVGSVSETPAQFNTIENNQWNGIEVSRVAWSGLDPWSNNFLGNTISNNSQYPNTSSFLPIELDKRSISDTTGLLNTNDSNDADDGPNEYQNHPTLQLINSNTATATMGGTLLTKPNTSYRIEFFAENLGTYLGSVRIDPSHRNNGSGVSSIPATPLNLTGHDGEVLSVSGTATEIDDSSGSDDFLSTSERSPGVSLGGAGGNNSGGGDDGGLGG